MSFTWLNKQGVRSDKGFEVQITGRFDAECSVGDKVIDIYIEPGMLNGNTCVSVSPGSFARWRNGTAIPPGEQRHILENFKAAMEFQGVAVLVED